MEARLSRAPGDRSCSVISAFGALGPQQSPLRLEIRLGPSFDSSEKSRPSWVRFPSKGQVASLAHCCGDEISQKVSLTEIVSDEVDS